MWAATLTLVKTLVQEIIPLASPFSCRFDCMVVLFLIISFFWILGLGRFVRKIFYFILFLNTRDIDMYWWINFLCSSMSQDRSID